MRDPYPDDRVMSDQANAATDAVDRDREGAATPYLMLGAICVGGAILAMALRPGRRRPAATDDERVHIARDADSASTQPRELWHNVRGALIGVASARIKDLVNEVLPGFDEHYRHAQERAAASKRSSASDDLSPARWPRDVRPY